MNQLPGTAQDTLKRAIAGLAAQAPEGQPDESVLVKLAEHLAIRFALERFESGEVKVNAVRQMLDRMNAEIENLRKILGAHEDKMTDAGIMVESHREILDRQFWAAVPESGKQAVLLSTDAWCIPPKNVQSYVAHLIETGDVAQAISILQNYASCADSEEPDARKKTAMGLSEMAELYAKADPKLLGEALRHLGLALERRARRRFADAGERSIREAQSGSRHQPVLLRDGAGARFDFRRRSAATRHRPKLAPEDGHRRTRSGICRRSSCERAKLPQA